MKSTGCSIHLGWPLLLSWGCVIFYWAVFGGRSAFAAVPAHDDAADPAYNNGWTIGSAGGTGWDWPAFDNERGWEIGNNGTNGSAFIGSSARNGDSIDT